MAGRILVRRKLNKKAESEESVSEGDVAAKASVDSPKKKEMGKALAAPKVRKVRAKKAPPRLWARWGVFDKGMKQVAIFNYNQRDAALEKVAGLIANGKGDHFLQIVKEPMPEPAPLSAPAVE